MRFLTLGVLALPAPTNPGELARAVPTWANFYYLLGLFGGSPPAPSAATYLTENNETATLPNSLQLVAGLNITLTPVGSTYVISSTGGGTGTVTGVTGSAPIVVTPATPNPNVSITDFVASGASHARGSVPDPGAVAGTTKFLREDATFAVPPGGSSSGLSIIIAKVFGRT